MSALEKQETIFNLDEGFAIYSPVIANMMEMNGVVLVNATAFAKGTGVLPHPDTCRRIDIHFAPGQLGLDKSNIADFFSKAIDMLRQDVTEAIMVTGLNFLPMAHILPEGTELEDGGVLQWQEADLAKLVELVRENYPEK